MISEIIDSKAKRKMSNDKDKNSTLSNAGRKTLQLKPMPAGQVASAGGVVVQRKKKLIMPGQAAAAPKSSGQKTLAPKPVKQKKRQAQPPKADGRILTAAERETRQRVLEQAKKDDAENAKKRAILEAARTKLDQENLKTRTSDAEKHKENEAKLAENLERKKAAEKKAAEETAAEDKAKDAKKAKDAPAPKAAPAPVRRDERKPAGPRLAGTTLKNRNEAAPKKAVKGEENRRGGGRLTVQQALAGNRERQRSMAALRRKRAKDKRKFGIVSPAKKLFREVVVPDEITVAELANRMTEKVNDVVRSLMKMGVMASGSEMIDHDTAELIVEEFGHKPVRRSETDVEQPLYIQPDTEETLQLRAPVVTIMGHVDHGKTSILDHFRKSNVVDGEAGGITQHIAAYQVRAASGDKITFLDTPGHAAFTAMRARGALATDIVVLVVAADDGLMPQTIEAIAHAKAADVPIIVAINKIDMPGSDPQKIKTDLLQHEVFVEDMGGDILTAEISAKFGTNMEKLEEAILMQAELMDFKANPERRANAVVVESKLDKARGPVATVLVMGGTLKIGDDFVVGAEYGRVRALINEYGKNVRKALPSSPTEVLGLNGVPSSGDELIVVESENIAREISEYRTRVRQLAATTAPKISLENIFDKLREEEISKVPLVLKTDVQGSLEAIVSSLDDYATDEVQPQFIHKGVGGITESDVVLAGASGAPILGFNCRASAKAAAKARQDGVEIRYYSIIYDLLDDVKNTMSGLLKPELKETIIGTAEVLDIFSAGKTGKAAGCLVLDGVMKKGAKARLLRDDIVIFTGDLGSLRRFKDDVSEVESGVECGMNFKDFTDIKKGDKFECFEVEVIERSLD